MTLLLRNHEIRELMGFAEYIKAVEEGYREVGLGRGVNIPRQSLWVEGGDGGTSAGGHLKPEAKGSFEVKGALLPGLGSAGLNAYTTGLGTGLNTYMFLFDINSGALAAIMDVLYYDWLKTAAVTAVATKYLAPQDASVAAVFGTGRHARTQLHAICNVRPIERIQAYSRNRQNLEIFCETMSRELEVAVVPAKSPEQAIKNVDLIITITKSPTPVFDGRLLEERPIHINAMGAHHSWVREIDETVVLSSRIILDEWQQGLQEQGEILIPIKKNLLHKTDVHGDLADIIVGRVPGREESTNWTLFLSGGTGIEDVAVTKRLYELACQHGVGTQFEFDQSLDQDLKLV